MLENGGRRGVLGVDGGVCEGKTVTVGIALGKGVLVLLLSSKGGVCLGD